MPFSPTACHVFSSLGTDRSGTSKGIDITQCFNRHIFTWHFVWYRRWQFVKGPTWCRCRFAMQGFPYATEPSEIPHATLSLHHMFCVCWCRGSIQKKNDTFVSLPVLQARRISRQLKLEKLMSGVLAWLVTWPSLGDGTAHIKITKMSAIDDYPVENFEGNRNS